MAFLLVLTGCNVDKAKIKKVDIKNLEYLSGNFISFEVSVKPNSFEGAKVYLVSKSNYDNDTFGNALYEYSEKMPEGKFTVSYENYESGLYYLFVSVKGKDLKFYDSSLIEIDLTRNEPTLSAEIVNNFTDNVTLELKNLEKDVKTISYCMVDDINDSVCENPIVVEDYDSVLSVDKNGKNFILFYVEDLIGNNKNFIINLATN